MSQINESEGQSTCVSVLSTLTDFGRLVKFSHTIFALPFALSMLVVISREHAVPLLSVVFIFGALVTARTAAMAFNRLVDRQIDSRNPRTSSRELPRGVLAVSAVKALCGVSILLFLLCAALLGLHCLILAPLVLLVLLGYSYMKRVSEFSHIVLGLALAAAPGGVWYALVGTFDLLPVWMMLGVLFWVAGFDILYSCQDYHFDKAERLYSVPSRFGIERAFQIARISHVIAFVFLVVFATHAELGMFHWIGLALFGVFLCSQHTLVSPTSLERIDLAFFTRNGVASVLYFFGTLLDRIA